jgi:diaminopimelate decarboxylase
MGLLGCMDPLAFDDALQRSRTVFAEAASLGFEFKLLDIGGGFIGTEKPVEVEVRRKKPICVMSQKLTPPSNGLGSWAWFM